MEGIHGVVQNVVMVGEGEYRVTFRAYNATGQEPYENEDVPLGLFSMLARVGSGDCRFVPEGPLTDCVNVLRENSSIETVPVDDMDKWKIGALAGNIASSLVEGGMFTAVNVEED